MAIANVVELKRVVSQCETATLKDVAKAISIKLRLADQNANDAKVHREEVGIMLVTLRKRVEADDQDWWKFVHDYFDRTRKELEKLMAYVPANKVAKAAIEAHPLKSDRAIAAEIGIGKDTIRRARDTVGANAPTEKRTGKDGKQYKASKPTKPADSTQQHPEAEMVPPQQPEPRKLPKPPKIDMNVIKQAGAFHIELTKYSNEFCAGIRSWHVANKIDEESHGCVVEALETASMRLQLLAQEIDDR